jgi:2',3'-cyclic-nucleotide 2'-phosphodiesterase (5'-nucleotidase family)
MASTYAQPVGGVQVVFEKGKLASLLIDGQPVDDEKVYGVATNSFLLSGGDGFYLGKDALVKVVYDDLMQDAMLESIRKTTASGKPFEYKSDGRVVIKK